MFDHVQAKWGTYRFPSKGRRSTVGAAKDEMYESILSSHCKYVWKWMASKADKNKIKNIEKSTGTWSYLNVLEQETAHVECGNYLFGWQGLFAGKEGRKFYRMKTIRNENPRIWYNNFGIPRLKNVITIINSTTRFNNIWDKMWPPKVPNFDFSGQNVLKYYYFADSFYPKLLVFALAHLDPSTRKQNLYGVHRYMAHMDEEYLFGVLCRKFYFCTIPPEFKI